MIKKLINIKKSLLSNIKIRKLVHYKKELNLDDSSSQHIISISKEDVSFQYYPKVNIDIVKQFNFGTKPLIEENTGCIIVKIKNDVAGYIFIDLQPIGKLLLPFKYEIKLGTASAYIHGLFVEKKFRGQGLSKLLYIQAFKFLKGGFKYAHVLVEEENFIANNMVQQLGFKKFRSFALIKIFNAGIDYNTNNNFKKLILAFFVYLAKRIYRFIRLPITFYERKAGNKNNAFFKLFILNTLKSNNDIIVTYFCKSDLYLPFVHRIFPEGYVIKKVKKILKAKLEDEIQEITDNVDLLIVEDNFKNLFKRFSHMEDAMYIPNLVLQRNDSFVNIEALLKKRNKSLMYDIKAVKKNGYGYIFTRDKNLIKFFYENMYAPYINNRHNNFAFISPFNLVFNSFKKGGLIFLKHKNRFLSGSVVEFKNKELRVKYFGILNGDISLLKKDVLSALYYFCFKFAQEKEFSVVDFRFSRGFLNDGVLRYKAKWDTKVSFNKEQNKVFLLKIIKLTPSIKDFLLHNPFISLENKRILVGNIFLDSEMYVEKDKYINRLKINGLNKLRVAYLNGLQTEIKEEIVNLKSY